MGRKMFSTQQQAGKKRGKHSRKIEENPAGVNCYFYSLINFSLENITWVKATLN